MRLGILLACSTLGCADVSQDATVFACDPQHPCPGSQVCSGTTGVCLDHAVLLYEDFETPLDALIWEKREVSGGTVAIEEGMAHWGDGSLRCSVPATAVAAIEHAFSENLPSHVFVRLFVRNQATTPYATYLRFNDNPNNETSYFSFHAEQDRLFFKAGRDGGAVTTADGGSLPDNAWACVEIELANLPTSGDGNAEIRIYLNDSELVALARSAAQMRWLRYVQIGGYSGSTASMDVDDVVVDTQRIGCAK